MFLGCDMLIQLVLSSEWNDYDRLEDLSSCTDYVMDYKICNILCLNK